MSQKFYIDIIKKVSFNELMCANNFFNQKAKEYTPGKRYPLGKYEIFDHITTSSNQVVYELDAKAYTKNYEIAKKIIKALENLKVPYYIFASGGKGIHIETWFNELNLTNEEIIETYKEAISYGLSFKHIRHWIWNKVLDEAGINEELRGPGKTLDSACMDFNDLLGKTRLLRVCGGRKQIFDPNTGETETNYKTYLEPHNFTNKRIKINNYAQVNYPHQVYTFEINEYELGEYCQQFIEQAKALQVDKSINLPSTKIGGYLNLEGVKIIREGLKEGQRAFGAQILAIAMANDDMPMEEQFKIMESYAANCSQIGHPFLAEEAFQWSHWLKKQQFVFWNCGLLDKLDAHDKASCRFCQEKNEKAIKFLNQTTLLNQIKDVLDITIIGEDDTKMLLFLLCLSKDFPSKTGSPGWNIFGDPMSQNIILCSDSSSGKSWITKKVLELFGEKNEDYFVVSRYTKNAINYYTEVNMDNKIIFIEEMQGLDENTTQLRVWMSEGELTLTSVEKLKDSEGNEVNTLVQKTTKGQPVFITNQAEGAVEDQLNNRSWILETDTSYLQTSKILDFQDRTAKGHITSVEEKKRIIKDALRQLKPYHFVVPYADWKLLGIKKSEVRSRRDYEKLLTLIKCNAYLHQRQRKIIRDEQGNEYIMCNFQDYEIAVQYASGILGATFSGLTNQQINIINFIKSQDWKYDFQRSDIMANLGKSQPYWSNQLKQLCNLGYLTEESSNGKASKYSLVLDKTVDIINLPSSEKLAEKMDPNLLQAMNEENTISMEQLKQLVIGSDPDSRRETDKDEPIIEDSFHARAKKQQGKKEEGIGEGGSVIGSNNQKVTVQELKEKIKKQGSHWVSLETIRLEIGEDQTDKIDEICSFLASRGDIIIKDQKVMLIN